MGTQVAGGTGRFCLRAEPPEPSGKADLEERRSEQQDRGNLLACAFCRRPVTTAAARIAVGGSHEHTFTNPAGLRFHVGCFADGAGLLSVGEPTTYWTWFPPYRWQIEQCGGCREHLGWLFRSGDHGFHGFILDRLVPLEE